MLKDQESFFVSFNSNTFGGWYAEYNTPDRFQLFENLDIPEHEFEVKLVNITIPRMVRSTKILVCVKGLESSYAHKQYIPLIAVLPCPRGCEGWDSFHFESDIYRPLKRALRTSGDLEIYLVDEQHKPIEFEDTKKSTSVTLHFRKMKTRDTTLPVWIK